MERKKKEKPSFQVTFLTACFSQTSLSHIYSKLTLKSRRFKIDLITVIAARAESPDRLFLRVFPLFLQHLELSAP